jgi:hypothetical protein
MMKCRLAPDRSLTPTLSLWARERWCCANFIVSIGVLSKPPRCLAEGPAGPTGSARARGRRTRGPRAFPPRRPASRRPWQATPLSDCLDRARPAPQRARPCPRPGRSAHSEWTQHNSQRHQSDHGHGAPEPARNDGAAHRLRVPQVGDQPCPMTDQVPHHQEQYHQDQDGKPRPDPIASNSEAPAAVCCCESPGTARYAARRATECSRVVSGNQRRGAGSLPLAATFGSPEYTRPTIAAAVRRRINAKATMNLMPAWCALTAVQ